MHYGKSIVFCQTVGDGLGISGYHKLELVKTTGFEKVKYRKISPFTFQCIANK